MLSALLGLLTLSGLSFAQLNPSVVPTRQELTTARRPLTARVEKPKNGLPNIVLIGYWPPSNEMLREFSPYVENWEGRGYNVFAFFPEFPDGLGIGAGDFQVDYQATAKSFWEIVPGLEPRAILSFGRAQENKDWEIEQVTRNLSTWIDDYLTPLSPTPTPPDRSLPIDHPRFSRFPGNEIVAALKRSGLPLNPLVDAGGAGGYLCEYLGFHLSWYRETNPNSVAFAAHTHIGSASRLSDLKQGVKITLRTLIRELVAADPADTNVGR
jgi:pyrrolidone-carboxylate peptidase